MFKLVIVGTIATLAFAEHPINKNIIQAIKSATNSWTPYEEGENPLGNLSVDRIKALLGTNVLPPFEIPEPEHSNDVVPESFDGR